MAKCDECGNKFKIQEARDEYESYFDGELDYDEDFGGSLCANCAISRTESEMNVGKAIDMMNGDEDYDDFFVQRWL